MKMCEYDSKEFIGKVNFSSGDVFYGDPCNGEKLLCLCSIKPGEYNVCITREDNIATLIIEHCSVMLKEQNYNPLKHCFVVESGNTGIFDKETFGKDDAVINIPKLNLPLIWRTHSDFYRAMCYLAGNDINKQYKNVGIYEYGVCSDTGGDGCFNVMVSEINNEIVGLALIFSPGKEQCLECGGYFHDYEIEDGLCERCRTVD